VTADLHGVLGALVEQAHEDFVDAVDRVAEAFRSFQYRLCRP